MVKWISMPGLDHEVPGLTPARVWHISIISSLSSRSLIRSSAISLKSKNVGCKTPNFFCNDLFYFDYPCRSYVQFLINHFFPLHHISAFHMQTFMKYCFVLKPYPCYLHNYISDICFFIQPL